jgi:hypothetical protein
VSQPEKANKLAENGKKLLSARTRIVLKFFSKSQTIAGTELDVKRSFRVPENHLRAKGQFGTLPIHGRRE